MTKRGAQPRRQFADAERLLDIVVGAEIERLDLLRLPIARRENDHRRLRERPDVAQHLLAVPIGQAEIEHDEIGRAGDRHAHGLRAGFGRDDLVARGGERDMQEPLDLRLVVDDENAAGARVGHAAAFTAMADGSAAGRRTTMRVPLRRTAGLCATIVPPIDSIRPRQIERPSPVPGLRPSARPPR